MRYIRTNRTSLSIDFLQTNTDAPYVGEVECDGYMYYAFDSLEEVRIAQEGFQMKVYDMVKGLEIGWEVKS